MSESPLELQDRLPSLIQLLQYVPNRKPFSRGDRNAATVRTSADLPPYLILGSLDEATFQTSSSGWSTRWQGLENNTYFDATFNPTIHAMNSIRSGREWTADSATAVLKLLPKRPLQDVPFTFSFP